MCWRSIICLLAFYVYWRFTFAGATWGGVRVMKNEPRYPVVLWEWGCGGENGCMFFFKAEFQRREKLRKKQQNENGKRGMSRDI